MSQPRQIHYSDFTMNFTKHPVTGDLGRVTEEEAVRRSVKSLLLTSRYERLLNPNIGSNLKKILFEPMDGSTTLMLRNFITETLTNHEPRCKIQDLRVVPFYDQNRYDVSLYFSVFFSESLSEIKFSLQRVR